MNKMVVFCRRHFQMHFHERKVLVYNSHKYIFDVPIETNPSLGQIMVLVSNSQHIFTWTNDDTIYNACIRFDIYTCLVIAILNISRDIMGSSKTTEKFYHD